MCADDRSRPQHSMLAEVDERYLRAAAIERAVYTLWRPFLAPLRVISGYVSRDRRRRGQAR